VEGRVRLQLNYGVPDILKHYASILRRIKKNVVVSKIPARLREVQSETEGTRGEGVSCGARTYFFSPAAQFSTT
jgi:hypothetical protein